MIMYMENSKESPEKLLELITELWEFGKIQYTKTNCIFSIPATDKDFNYQLNIKTILDV